jgi:hypothetical protein
MHVPDEDQTKEQLLRELATLRITSCPGARQALR